MDVTVTNLNDAGGGSLRWAMDAANRQAGFDQIRVDSSLSGGTINLAADLASITDQVAIQGLQTSSGGVALVDAGGDALTLDTSGVTIQNCLIGVGLNGASTMGNRGHGIRITAGSNNNLDDRGQWWRRRSRRRNIPQHSIRSVIPLGNVNAGDQGNGINVIDHVEDFITFNTFAGLTAFGGIAPNQKSGIRISSDGGRHTMRTNVMASNIGLNTYDTQATYTGSDGEEISWSNGSDGIRRDDRARGTRTARNRGATRARTTRRALRLRSAMARRSRMNS